MIRVCKENRESVLEQVRNGKIDAAMLSTTNLIDEIILTMHTKEFFRQLVKVFQILGHTIQRFLMT